MRHRLLNMEEKVNFNLLSIHGFKIVIENRPRRKTVVPHGFSNEFPTTKKEITRNIYIYIHTHTPWKNISQLKQDPVAKNLNQKRPSEGNRVMRESLPWK